MTVQIKFFAQLKEQLNCAELDFQLSSQSATVADIKSQLMSKGEVWQKSLAGNQVLMAVNQQLVHEDAQVQDGDEVAFFPPVTGG